MRQSTLIASFCSVAFVLVMVPAVAKSQAPPGAPNLAIPYATNYGVGGFSGSGVSARVLQFRTTITLVHHAQGKVGVGLRLAGSLGGFDLSNIADFDRDNVTTVGFMPGIELRVPLGRNAMLRPYTDIGGVTSTRQTGSETLYVGAGVLAEFVFWHRAFEFGLEPRLEFAASRSAEESFEEEYTALFLKADVRHPLWFSGGRYLPSFGAYVQGGYYLDAIDIGETGRITTELEAGFSFGMCPRPKIVLFRVPRIHVGYRNSSGVHGLRITFTDRLLRCTEDRRN